jgi:hypothetical protein
MITASYVVELRPVEREAVRAGLASAGRKAQVPGIVRLRRALKCLLRAYGLRCVSVAERKAQGAVRVAPAVAAVLFSEMRAAIQ